MVARRQNEIGVRMALGADRARVVRRLILRAAPCCWPPAWRSAPDWRCGRAAPDTLLFGLKPWDPATLAGAALLLSSVALIAEPRTGAAGAALPGSIH